MTTDVVCLCTHHDLKALYAEGFARHTDLRLLTPDEVADPSAVEIAIAFNPPPDAFERFHALKLLHSVGAGVDGLLKHPGLLPEMAVVRMVNPEQARMMAGFAVWHVVSWHRRLWEYPALQARRHWEVLDASPASGFPVAVLGWGNMGRACGEALAGLGYPVTAWAGTAREEAGIRILAGEDGLAEALRPARAIVNVLPLTEATRCILDDVTFGYMRPDALLVQLGRGGHLVEPDLIAALDAGRPGMAALDVMETEPLPPESPLWSHPRIRVTPHCASESSPEAVADAVAANIVRWQAGEPMTGLVDRGRGY
ncbi:MAG: glyoxylate/hydroxypyruvate reductase A [Pseudomonadota bacterium]